MSGRSSATTHTPVEMLFYGLDVEELLTGAWKNMAYSQLPEEVRASLHRVLISVQLAASESESTTDALTRSGPTAAEAARSLPSAGEFVQAGDWPMPSAVSSERATTCDHPERLGIPPLKNNRCPICETSAAPATIGDEALFKVWSNALTKALTNQQVTPEHAVLAALRSVLERFSYVQSANEVKTAPTMRFGRDYDRSLVKDCICADPENCTQPVPGYRCRRIGASPDRTANQ